MRDIEISYEILKCPTYTVSAAIYYTIIRFTCFVSICIMTISAKQMGGANCYLPMLIIPADYEILHILVRVLHYSMLCMLLFIVLSVMVYLIVSQGIHEAIACSCL